MKTNDEAQADIEHIFTSDPEVLRLEGVLRDQHRRLREAMSPEALQVYFDLEATTNAQWSIVAALAWEAGHRSE